MGISFEPNYSIGDKTREAIETLFQISQIENSEKFICSLSDAISNIVLDDIWINPTFLQEELARKYKEMCNEIKCKILFITFEKIHNEEFSRGDNLFYGLRNGEIKWLDMNFIWEPFLSHFEKVSEDESLLYSDLGSVLRQQIDFSFIPLNDFFIAMDVRLFGMQINEENEDFFKPVIKDKPEKMLERTIWSVYTEGSRPSMKYDDLVEYFNNLKSKASLYILQHSHKDSDVKVYTKDDLKAVLG